MYPLKTISPGSSMVCALSVNEKAVSSKNRKVSRSVERVLVRVCIVVLLFCKLKGKKIVEAGIIAEFIT